MFWSDWKGKENSLSNHWWYSPLFGLMGGFTTMIGNAADPVMAIYLLSVKMPKYNFVGTNDWFFQVVNYLKILIQVFAWDNITLSSLILDACTIPFIIIGGVLGIVFVKKTTGKRLPLFNNSGYLLVGIDVIDLSNCKSNPFYSVIRTCKIISKSRSCFDFIFDNTFKD